ncbi:hypothetical protein BC826DRAFT_642781 [Russula brevipes]|nr:hypothetical protein BC826DRAFT_642781 [Russula brevipes]
MFCCLTQRITVLTFDRDPSSCLSPSTNYVPFLEVKFSISWCREVARHLEVDRHGYRVNHEQSARRRAGAHSYIRVVLFTWCNLEYLLSWVPLPLVGRTLTPHNHAHRHRRFCQVLHLPTTLSTPGLDLRSGDIISNSTRPTLQGRPPYDTIAMRAQSDEPLDGAAVTSATSNQQSRSKEARPADNQTTAVAATPSRGRPTTAGRRSANGLDIELDSRSLGDQPVVGVGNPRHTITRPIPPTGSSSVSASRGPQTTQNERIMTPGAISSSASMKLHTQSHPAAIPSSSGIAPPTRVPQQADSKNSRRPPQAEELEPRKRPPAPQAGHAREKDASRPSAEQVDRTASVQPSAKPFAHPSPSLNRPGVSTSPSSSPAAQTLIKTASDRMQVVRGALRDEPQARSGTALSELGSPPDEDKRKVPPYEQGPKSPLGTPTGPVPTVMSLSTNPAGTQSTSPSTHPQHGEGGGTSVRKSDAIGLVQSSVPLQLTKETSPSPIDQPNGRVTGETETLPEPLLVVRDVLRSPDEYKGIVPPNADKLVVPIGNVSRELEGLLPSSGHTKTTAMAPPHNSPIAFRSVHPSSSDFPPILQTGGRSKQVAATNSKFRPEIALHNSTLSPMGPETSRSSSRSSRMEIQTKPDDETTKTQPHHLQISQSQANPAQQPSSSAAFTQLFPPAHAPCGPPEPPGVAGRQKPPFAGRPTPLSSPNPPFSGRPKPRVARSPSPGPGPPCWQGCCSCFLSFFKCCSSLFKCCF